MINKKKHIVTSFFTKGHERSILAKKNIAASFGIKAITMLITFVSFPLPIKYLDQTQYGIWLTLYSIIVWMTFFDIGLGNGLKNKFAEAKAKGELLLAKNLVSSTYVILFIILSILVILFFIANTFLDWSRILNAPESRSKELGSLAWITFAGFGALFVLRLIISIINADQKPAMASFIDMVSQLFCMIGIIILIKTTEGSLLKLGWLMAVVPVVVFLFANIILFNTRYKAFKPSFRCVDFGLSKQMVRLGLKFFVAGMSALVLFQTTNIMLSHLTTSADVSVYNTAFKLFSAGYNILGIIVFPYWSAFSDAYALEDFEWMKHSIRKLVKIFLLFTAGQVVILLLSGWIYAIWMRELLEVSFSISLSVCIYVCGLAWVCVCFYPLNGIGKMKLQFYSSIAEMICVIPLAIFLAGFWGAVGIILAPIIVSIPRMIWGPVQLKKLLNRTATGIWNQ